MSASDEVKRCEDRRPARYAPEDIAECSNRARYVDVNGNVFCGRHVSRRRVQPIP